MYLIRAEISERLDSPHDATSSLINGAVQGVAGDPLYSGIDLRCGA